MQYVSVSVPLASIDWLCVDVWGVSVYLSVVFLWRQCSMCCCLRFEQICLFTFRCYCGLAQICTLTKLAACWAKLLKNMKVVSCEKKMIAVCVVVIFAVNFAQPILHNTNTQQKFNFPSLAQFLLKICWLRVRVRVRACACQRRIGGHTTLQPHIGAPGP